MVQETESIIDVATLSVRNDIFLSRFLYIEWNSENTRDGAGLGHIMYSIRSLIEYYLKLEPKERTFIFSDMWRPGWETHSILSKRKFVDFREYYNIGPNIGVKFETPVKIYFDHKGIFRDTFITENTIGIANSSRRLGKGLTSVRANNKNIVEVNQLEEEKIIRFDYNFWCGTWHTYDIHNKRLMYSNNVRINTANFFAINKQLQNQAHTIADIISQNFSFPFYVMHLRRGDRLFESMVAGSSEIEFVKTQLINTLPKNSRLYIMTNGTLEYLTTLVAELSSYFRVFTKLDFENLMRLEEYDNFALYTLETELSNMCFQKFTNKDFCFSNKFVVSLLFNYINQPRPIHFTREGDVLVQLSNENTKYICQNSPVQTFAFGRTDSDFVFSKSNGFIIFDNKTFGEDPALKQLRYGYIKIGNKNDLQYVGEEEVVVDFKNQYAALYGVDNTFVCKIMNKGSTAFTNSVFGDPKFGCKKQCFVMHGAFG